MNKSIDTSNFDVVFYPKKSAINSLIFLFIVEIVIALGVFFYLFFNTKILGLSWSSYQIRIGLSVALIMFFIFNLFMVILLSKRMKTLQVGFNKDLLYIKSYGIVGWEDIQKIEIGFDADGKKQIKIMLTKGIHPDRRKYGSEIFIAGLDVDANLQELCSMLKDYHEKH